MTHIRPQATEAGFGLLEMIIAFTVLLVVLVATAELTSTLLGQAATAHSQVTATDLADETLNQLANEPISQLSPDVNQNVTLAPVSLSGGTYTLTQYLHWAGTGDAHSLCLTGNPPQVLQATVTVGWGQGQRLAETSVINPPYGEAQSTDGWLSVLIQSAADPSQPPADVGAVGVVITPQGSSPLPTDTPDSTGCVYAAVPPGTYTVALQSPASPAFVDTEGQASPSSTEITVSQGQASDVSFLYDQAALVSFQPAATSPPLATGMPISVGNSGLTSGSMVVVAAGSGGAGPADLFPYPTGYQVWYGDCPAEAPGNSSDWTKTSPPTTAVAPGQRTTATAGGLAELDLSVNASGAGPVNASAILTDPHAGLCPSDTYGLGQGTVTGGTAAIAAQIIPEDYTVTITDAADGASARIGLAWDPSTGEWADTATGTEYAPTTPIPVSVG